MSDIQIIKKRQGVKESYAQRVTEAKSYGVKESRVKNGPEEIDFSCVYIVSVIKGVLSALRLVFLHQHFLHIYLILNILCHETN